jgi:hypothetical protein
MSYDVHMHLYLSLINFQEALGEIVIHKILGDLDHFLAKNGCFLE